MSLKDAWPVLPGEKPWSKAEIAQANADVQEEITRLSAELSQAQEHLVQLQDGPGGPSGEDPVDSGAKAYERESELALVDHATITLHQARRAMVRIERGLYATCESCGGPIGKRRLQAFPRAIQCISCKEREERQR